MVVYFDNSCRTWLRETRKMFVKMLDNYLFIRPNDCRISFDNRRKSVLFVCPA